MEEYMVSALKYRPLNFDSVVGQRSLTTTLKNAITSGKLAHAYLFCGPRGVGKTTCARIFAKAINCMNPVNGNPCLECEMCRDADASALADIIAGYAFYAPITFIVKGLQGYICAWIFQTENLSAFQYE